MFKPAFRTELRSSAGLCLGFSFLVAVVFIAAELAPFLILQDFTIYWRATKEWLAGGNPYELPYHQAYLEGVVGFTSILPVTLKVWTPPTFLMAMAPFAFSSLLVGKIIYLSAVFLAIAGWICLAYRSLCLTLESKSVGSKIGVAVVSVVAFPWVATGELIKWGGMSVLSSLAFLVLASTPRSASPIVWGIVFLLLSLKPHPATLTIATLFLLSSPRERKDALRGLALAALLVLAPIVLRPELLSNYWSLSLEVPFQHQLYSATLYGALLRLGISGILAAVTSLMCAAFVVAVARQRASSCVSPPSKAALAILVTPLSVFLAPYGWAHDFFICSGFLWACITLYPQRRVPLALVTLSGILLNLQQIPIIPAWSGFPLYTALSIWAALSLLLLSGGRLLFPAPLK